MKSNVYARENRYFAVMVIVSLALYATIIVRAFFAREIILPYSIGLAIFFTFIFLTKLYLVGYLRGNAIRVTEHQFPEIFEIVQRQAEKLSLKKVPDLYILQGHGVLNAFATRLTGRNYIVLYSDVLAAAYKEGMEVVEFIVGHELGHLKRNHVGAVKSLFLFPARSIPFLGSAYSRACEYTCDAIGYTLCPEGAEKGILLLGAGKELSKRVNVGALLHTAYQERGFMTWFAEIFASHPHLLKRLARFDRTERKDITVDDSFVMVKDKAAVREFDGHGV